MMDADPDKWPTMEKIKKIISIWANSFYMFSHKGNSIKKEFYEMDKIEFDPSTITATTHPNAIYTSKLLKFQKLPQPVNSNKVTIIRNNYGNYY
jgi:hypothetical protein